MAIYHEKILEAIARLGGNYTPENLRNLAVEINGFKEQEIARFDGDGQIEAEQGIIDELSLGVVHAASLFGGYCENVLEIEGARGANLSDVDVNKIFLYNSDGPKIDLEGLLDFVAVLSVYGSLFGENQNDVNAFFDIVENLEELGIKRGQRFSALIAAAQDRIGFNVAQELEEEDVPGPVAEFEIGHEEELIPLSQMGNHNGGRNQ